MSLKKQFLFISLLFAAGLFACCDSDHNTSGDLGQGGNRCQFLRLVDDQYVPINFLNLDHENLQTDIAYGYVDNNGNATLYTSKFEVRNAWGDDPIDYVTTDPSGTDTETCTVTAEAAGGDGMPYILCTPDNCPSVLCASLPIYGFSGSGSAMHFLQKGDNGKYKSVNYISAGEGITTVTIAYGDIDSNGNATLYDTKYWARDNVQGPNGFLTVAPAGMNTKDCVVVVNTGKEQNCNFLYCEPDNYPGVICATLPIIVTYGQ
jgi:hypothetical protein